MTSQSPVLESDSTDESITEQSREGKNQLFNALANHRGRYVLYACNKAGGEATLSDIAEQVASWEYGKEIDMLTSKERKRIYTSLQQHHLSKLEAAGLLEIDDDRTIRTTQKAKNLDLYVEFVPSNTIPWSLYYLGLAAIGGVTLGLYWLEWLPEAVSSLTLSITFLLVIAISGIVHYYQSKDMQFSTSETPPEVDDTG